MIKKLEGTNAELFKAWFHDNENTIVDIEGKHYLIKPLHNIVQEEIENDHELKQLILQAKDNIANDEVYTTQEIIDFIQNGDL
jgi:hypothetical protein